MILASKKDRRFLSGRFNDQDRQAGSSHSKASKASLLSRISRLARDQRPWQSIPRDVRALATRGLGFTRSRDARRHKSGMATVCFWIVRRSGPLETVDPQKGKRPIIFGVFNKIKTLENYNNKK